jgi:glutamine synthetase
MLEIGMASPDVELNPNPIVRFLETPPAGFTKEGLIRFIEANDIKLVNLRHVAGDGRLKTLNFVITSKRQLDHLLTFGERVDGSSLFTYVDAASSDLYLVPRYQTAYVNPFATVPTVDILSSYFTSDGEPLPSAPTTILAKASQSLLRETGLEFEAMGELEFYVYSRPDPSYPVSAQRGYQESSPFTKWEDLRVEAMQAIAAAGGKIKYGHSEVGCISGGDLYVEQHEIEFQPVPVQDAVDQLTIAKWALRMIGKKHGVTITFAPKILVGHAGSGLHIHMRVCRDGKNVMMRDGVLSDTARHLIAGVLDLAPSLTAFGNPVPTSYLRLVPHQEAPTNICWGSRNRSAAIRVPLSGRGADRMVQAWNARDGASESGSGEDSPQATIEFRCPDGSAKIGLLMAGLVVAARHGQTMDNAFELVDRLHVNVNIFADEHRELRDRLPQLPSSCSESADRLLAHRAIYEQDGVFSPGLIDNVAKQLHAYDDRGLSERFYGRGEEIRKLVEDFLHHA